MTWYFQVLKEFFSDARTVDGNICIGDTSLSKYMEKYIKPMSNRNKITCGFKTCISDMLLQSYLNKWRISQWSKLNKLYINSTSTRISERSNNDCIEYKKRISPNDSHIRDYFTSQITRSSVLWYWNCNLVQIFKFFKRGNFWVEQVFPQIG